MRKVVAIFMLVMLFNSCKEEKVIKAIAVDEISEHQVVIMNEGNFQWGQGTISLYSKRNKTVLNKVFLANNNQRPLGDVAQSLAIKGDTAFIVVNNSNKIEVVNLRNFQSIGNILDLNSPREVLLISSTKAYVSDLYDGAIQIINPSTFAKIAKITTGGWTEEMLLFGNNAFVCQVDSNQILVIDIKSNQIIQRIPTATSPQYLEIDKNSVLWVSCSGGLGNDTAALQQIDPVSMQLIKTFKAQTEKESFSEIAMNAAGDALFYLSPSGLFKLPIMQDSLSNDPFISATNRNFYAFNIDPSTNEIYICDAIDYQQRGVVYRYDIQGDLMEGFKVGIIPGAVYFKN